MPSPDIRQFVDLTLYDLESQSIYLRALDYMKVVFPEFQPTEGSLESVILQSMAIEVANLVTSINRLPGGVVQVLLRLFDVQRSEGIPPTAVVELRGSTSSSYTIPAGTRLFYQSTLNSTPLVLVTDSIVQLTHAKSVSNIAVVDDVATVTTADYHGFSIGETVTLAGFTDTDFDDPFEIISVGNKTFSFAIVKADTTETPTAATATPSVTHPATGYVTATGTLITDGFNGLPTGTRLDLLSVVPQVASAYLATAITGGANAEDDLAYFQRASANLARVNDSLVTADNYTQWVTNSSTFTEVYRATTLDGVSFARQSSASCVTLVVAPIDVNSTNLFSGVGDGLTDQDSVDWGTKDEIQLAASSISHPLSTVAVVDPFLITVSCAVSASPYGTTNGTEMSAAVTSALQSLIDPNTWPWATTLRKNDVIAACSTTTNINGERAVTYVSSAVLSITDAKVPSSGARTTPPFTTTYSSPNRTLTTTPAHGMSSANTNYVSVYDGTDWWLTTVTIGSTTQFTFSTTGNIGATVPTDWAFVGYVDGTTGDIVFADQAPLVISGSHVISVV
jgi:hypothetical protein